MKLLARILIVFLISIRYASYLDDPLLKIYLIITKIKSIIEAFSFAHVIIVPLGCFMQPTPYVGILHMLSSFLLFFWQELLVLIQKCLFMCNDHFCLVFQDLPNYAQHMVPIFSLPQEWLWCESWCGNSTKPKAKTIDLCNNPMTKEPKLQVGSLTSISIISHLCILYCRGSF